ncbi:hypothetical protein GCM10027614_08800 [Micromonospora vulcania]
MRRMDLRDSADEAEFRAGLREWLADAVPVTSGPDGAPAPGRWDDIAAVRSFTCALHAAGYAGLTWPAEHGGRGLSPAYQAIYLEETARAEAAEHIGVIGLGMVGPTIIARGSSSSAPGTCRGSSPGRSSSVRASPNRRPAATCPRYGPSPAARVTSWW